MANAQRTEAVAMIEERVESGLRELMSGYQPSFMLGGPNRDELNKRFSIKLGSPLPQFDTGGAKAYEATDALTPTRGVYALVMHTNYSPRIPTIEKLIGLQHPHILSVLEHGSVFFTSSNQAHHVVIIEKPLGKRLSDIIAKQQINQEHVIKESILAPLTKALGIFKEKAIVHGGINTKNIYVGDALQLGECVGELTGLSQDYIYEAPERIMCDPVAKGIGSEKVDVYACGVLAYELLYGLEHLRKIPKEEFLLRLLHQGIFAVFASNRDFPDILQDFFRGIFADNPNERWSFDQLNQWVNGKRFNMINPTKAQDAARPIHFNDMDFYSQRELAFALRNNWRDALKDIRGLKLDRWAEMSLHKIDIAERLARVIHSASNEAQASEKQNNEMLTRSITILDPAGPIRTSLLSLRPDGIGNALAEFHARKLTSELQETLEIIESDISSFWGELNDAGKNADFAQSNWKLQRAKMQLRSKGLGFGIERALYELNPHLPCQSPLVAAYNITNLADLLRTLDTLAKKLAPDTSLLDKHIAAFIAAKADMGKEVRLHDLASIPALAESQELVMMKILIKAQQKHSKTPLPGLCIWTAMRVEQMLDNIHNRTLRKKLKLHLKNVVVKGQLSEVVYIIVNRDVATRDYDGFAKAIAMHQFNGQRIEALRNPKLMEKLSRDLGGRIATTIAYTILFVTLYITFSHFIM